MTNFSGKHLNAACGGPQGGGMDSRRNGVAEVSPKYLADVATNGVPVGYKQTEVGVIPDDWDVSPLSTMTSLMTNGFVGTAKTHYTDSHDGVTYIQGYNVEENGFNFNGIKRVTPEFHKKNSKSCLRTGDVLMVQTGDVGLVTIVPQELEGANCHALIISRFKKEIYDPKYFSYYLNSQQGRLRLKELETGTTMKHINVGDLLHFEVPYPRAKKEQTAIANALSDVDALISELEKLIAKKQAIKTATMQQLLTGRTRLPQFALRQDGTPKGTKPSELGEIPEDWEVVTLGDIAEVRMCKRILSYQTAKNGEIPFFKIGTFGGEPDAYISKSLYREFKTKFSYPEKGDVLISAAGTLGKMVVYDGRPSYFQDSNIVWLEIDKRKISNEYLYQYYKVIKWASSEGSTISRLYNGIIKASVIGIPSLAEQIAIATILSDMDEEIHALEQRLGKTRQIKQGMMQELLTGKTRLIQGSEAR